MDNFIKIALAGNPNCGKTTLFNELTGGRAHVGNWAGVTVERREGEIRGMSVDSKSFMLVDLPGIYSLTPYSPEEKVAGDFLINETPDLIINIIDSTNLERSLFLTTQLLETNCQVVVALNMSDFAKKSGIIIDSKQLEKRLGVEVVEICALKREGFDALLSAITRSLKKSRSGVSIFENGNFTTAFSSIKKIADSAGESHSVFRTTKFIEGTNIFKSVKESSLENLSAIRQNIEIEDAFDGDICAAIANKRYKFINDNFSNCAKYLRESESLTVSDEVDKVLTNKYLGLSIFFLMMFVVFHLTFGENLFYLSSLGLTQESIPAPGVWMLGLTEVFMEWVGDGLTSILEFFQAQEWVKGLLIDGALGGLGAVLSFLPQIMMLFFFLSIMEDSGYMARAAFLMDRILRKFGLSGKAFLPLLMCFGCLVPAMMGTKTIENEKERKLTIMLAPFFSCGAKLPIWAMFSMALFPSHADLAIFSIYMLGIITAVIAAFILKSTILKGSISAFIIELPAYHIPHFRNVALNLWDKLKGFIMRATTIIAGATVVIWFLSNFSFSLEMVEANTRDSIIAVLGSYIQPIFQPLGFAYGDEAWKVIVAALTGLIAKEMVVSTLGVLYNPSVDGDALEDDAASSALITALAAAFSPLAAVSFMAFNLLSVPCMAAVATAHSQLQSTKWTLITIAFWIGKAWGVSFLIWQIGSLLGIGV